MTTATRDQTLRVSVELPVHGVSFGAVRELALAAEAAGLDGVWVPDHLVPLRAGAPPPLECWTLLAGVAAATRAVRVGPLVLVLPLRDPVLLASQARTLASIAGGRLTLGLGLGGFTYRRAASALGIAPRAATARALSLADAVAELRAGIRAGGGPEVPIVLGGRSRALLDAAAQVADGWNCPFVAELAERSAQLDAACLAAGRDPATLARSVYALAALGDTEDEARRRAATAGAMARLFGDFAHGGHLLGTPEAAVARLRALAAAGAREVVLHVAGDHAARLATLALLGREVLPALRA